MADYHNRLAFRLALILTIALAPLGSIAVYSEYENWESQREADKDDIIARTADAVNGPRALLESAMASARVLSPEVLDRLTDPAECSDYLAEAVSDSGFFSFAGFIDTDGQMNCLSEGEPVDFSESSDFAQAAASPRPTFTFQQNGAVTRRSVVLANYPVMDGDRFLGIMSISISNDRFTMISRPFTSESRPKVAFLVNHRGEVLIQDNHRDPDAILPEPELISQLISDPRNIVPSQTRAGEERTFTTAVLIPNQLYALASWDPDRPQTDTALSIRRLGFPVLMWVASIAVVMLAVHYLVVRHLKQINRQLRSFALGNRDAFQRLSGDAPRELRELDSTFSKMALLIRRDEVEQEEALREKTTLLMEVHHRVKNNLQLIASILNLQSRRVSDPAARTILQGVQGRVRSLATIHRTLYEQKQVSDSDATAFFETILQESMAMAQGDSDSLSLDTNFEPIAIAPDKIIPVALIFSEALTNALKHVATLPKDTPAQVSINCRSLGGFAELSIRNTSNTDAERAETGGLGQELMTAFALQINAELETGPAEDAEMGQVWQVRLLLSLPAEETVQTRKTAGRVL